MKIIAEIPYEIEVYDIKGRTLKFSATHYSMGDFGCLRITSPDGCETIFGSGCWVSCWVKLNTAEVHGNLKSEIHE